MKTFFKFLCLILAIPLISCSGNDEVNLNEQENRVLLRVVSNTPDAPISVLALGTEGIITIKDRWEKEMVTKSWGASIEAQCEDKNVLIKVEIYINGKLEGSNEGNGYVYKNVKIKGN